MPLISSKLVILILLVIFLSGCTESTLDAQPSSTVTIPLPPSPILPITPFPTVHPSTNTPVSTSTSEAAPSVTLSNIATPLPTNVIDIPNPEKYTWEVIAEGFSRPTNLTSPMDGSNRMFVLEQEGLIFIIQDDEILSVPFLDLRKQASTQGSTVRGLLGMVFHPKYAENGFFFIHYTQDGGNSVIARFQVSGDPNLADPNSEIRLLEISYPIGEHLGGGLAFGPDDDLYISIGDGGAGGNGDQPGNAQNPETLLGSLLRMDVDRSAEPEVLAIGLRNPWRFSFDTLNGDLYIADVGENQSEEINHLPAGSPAGINFGWNFFEGTRPYKGNPPENLDTTFPIWTYDHTLGCSVTGGFVYRGQSLPEWFGVYLYADYCSGNIWGLLQGSDNGWQNELLFNLSAYITSFGQDQAGEIYLVSITGKIYKLVKK